MSNNRGNRMMGLVCGFNSEEIISVSFNCTKCGLFSITFYLILLPPALTLFSLIIYVINDIFFNNSCALEEYTIHFIVFLIEM